MQSRCLPTVASTAVLCPPDLNQASALARELQRQVDAVNGGNMTRAEGMLVAQAHTRDELFNNLARRAHGQEHLLQYETHFRRALKA